MIVFADRAKGGNIFYYYFLSCVVKPKDKMQALVEVKNYIDRKIVLIQLL